MRATIHYNLEGDKFEFRMAQQALDLHGILWELERFLGDVDKGTRKIEDVRDWYYREKEARGVVLE